MNENRRKPFTPSLGEIYTSVNGNQYHCDGLCADGSAWFTNVRSGWHFNAKGIGVYQDGRIDWDYSVLGRFVEIPEGGALL